MRLDICLFAAYAYRSLGPALSVLSFILLLVFGVIGICLAAYLAALPGRIAAARGHPRTEAVRVCGWLGLLTGIGWVVAMVWAFAATNVRSSDLDAQVRSLDEAVRHLESVVGGKAK